MATPQYWLRVDDEMMPSGVSWVAPENAAGWCIEEVAYGYAGHIRKDGTVATIQRV